MESVWYALAQPTNEKINVSHIPAIGMDKVSGLADALAGKLSGITGEMVTQALGYTPYDASQIGSASVKYAASAGKVAHALSIVAGDVTTVYDGSAAKSVTVPTAEQIALWNKVGGLFDLDADGNVYVKDNRGFYGNSFVSARGGDPAAGSGGGSGVDMESVWYALAQPTTEKINVSHIPALQQLSGQITNAQLVNSAISVAGVTVALGGSVSAEQIATALGLGSNAYTSTAYLPLTGGTMSGALSVNSYIYSPKGLFGLTEEQADSYAGKAYYNLAVGQKSPSMGASLLLYRDSTSYQSYIVWSTETQDHIGIGLAADANDLIIENHKAGIQIKGTGNLTYNTYPLLHSGNYTNYTVTKTGVGASGTWPISVSGTATYATVLSNNDNTNVSQYLKYRAVSGQTSLVGSNAVNGAWCLPTTGGDAIYGNGQILRFGWAQSYYTDLHTGPNEIGSNSGLQFRQVVAGAVSSLGWRTLLDTANYAGTLDTRYLLKSAYTAADILAKLKTVDGSGSGLDADLLDGYQSTSFQFAVSNNYELSLSGGSRGRYVILLHPDTLSSANNSLPVGYSVQGTFHLFRPLGNGAASIIVKSGAGYSSTWNSGSIIAMPDYICFPSMKLVTCNYGGKLYRALFVDAIQDIVNLYFRGVVMNRDTNFGLAVKYYDYATSAVTNSEVNGSIADFQRYRAILFPQLIEGTITSAQKLATARSIWGQTFDGTQGVDGYLYLGSSDYRLYFGTSGVTSFLTSANGIFQLHKSNNTVSQRVLFAVNLSSENVGIGTTAPTDRLHVIGTIRATTGIWSDGYISAKGQDTTSDARYKRDVAALPAQAALAVLMRLRPSTWAWKDDGRRGAGFVAQEVQGVLPEAVREVGGGEDRHLALNYQMLHAYEVCLLQTHETELERLRGRVLLLENEIKRIRHGS